MALSILDKSELSMSTTVVSPRPRTMSQLSPDAEARAREIVEKLGGVWRGTRGECLCPAHDDSTPSLSVRLGDSAILFHCFAGCETIDVLKALDRLRLHDRAPLEMPERKPQRDLGELARRLWRASEPIAGSPAAAYLEARGISLLSPKLRYNPRTIFGRGATRRILPAMIAAVETDLGLIAVQRTFLDLQVITRKPLPNPKVALGLLGGAAVRLAPATDELGLAEGVEDALSAMEWFGTPSWALGGIERLAMVDIPATVRRIIVYGDRGRAADAGLDRARAHLTANGRTLEVRVPEIHDDWNDAWRARLAEQSAA